MTERQKAAVFHELAKLVSAGFHLDRALGMLRRQRLGAAAGEFLRRVEEGLQTGEGLAAAVRRAGTGGVDALDVALISAGERGGRLGESLAMLAGYHERAAGARATARRALIYPVILAHLAVVLPELPSLVSGQGPGGMWRAGGGLALLWTCLLGGGVAWRKLAARAYVSPVTDQWLGRIPFLGRVRRETALARFCHASHAGMLAGMPVREWLLTAAGASGSAAMRRCAERAADAIQGGATLAGGLKAGRGFPENFTDALETAEESGTLDMELRRWAVLADAATDEALQNAAVWLPRAVYALVVLLVVWRIFTMLDQTYGALLREL